MAVPAEIAALIAGRPDAYAGAADTIGGERAQMLAAMAQAGTAGKAAYEQARAAAQAQRQSALAALAAQLGGMPSATRAAAEASLDATADEQAGYLAADQANWSNALGASQTANDAYLGRLATVLPQIKASADANLTSNLMDSWAEVERAIEDSRRQTAMQLAQIRFNKAQQDSSWAREERMRQEAWDREERLIAEERAYNDARRGGGGGGGGGGRGGGGGSTTPTDPFGGWNSTEARAIVNGALFNEFNRLPLFQTNDQGLTQYGNPGQFDTGHAPRASFVQGVNTELANSAFDNADYLLNGGAAYGVAAGLADDDNLDSYYAWTGAPGESTAPWQNWARNRYGKTGPRREPPRERLGYNMAPSRNNSKAPRDPNSTIMRPTVVSKPKPSRPARRPAPRDR